MTRKLSPSPHFIGLAAGNDFFPRQQEFSAWSWESPSLVTEIEQETSKFRTFNSAERIDENLLRLTQTYYQSGVAVVTNRVVELNSQFSTKFIWTISDCDPNTPGQG